MQISQFYDNRTILSKSKSLKYLLHHEYTNILYYMTIKTHTYPSNFYFGVKTKAEKYLGLCGMQKITVPV